jgi:hypothetical protein
LADFDGNEALTGSFVAELPPGAGAPFTATDWVADDLAALVPGWVVRIDGTDYRAENTNVTLLEESAAHQRFFLKSRLAGAAHGFVEQVWVTFYSGQDDAEVKSNLVWSDRTVPEMETQVDAVAFESGEFIQLDFSYRNGHAEEPVRVNNKWVWVLSGGIGFNDGSAFPVCGRMLCLPQHIAGQESTSPLALVPGDDEINGLTEEPTPEMLESITLQQRIESLRAASEAPIKGNVIDGEWDGRFLAHKWTPRHQPVSPVPGVSTGTFQDANAANNRFTGMLGSVGPLERGTPRNALYHMRHMGLFYDPGRTGDQEDFGSTKGSMSISLGDPRWLWSAEQGIQGDYFRGVMHFEDDASILLYENHTQWWTWSGTTHFRQHPPDTLGKVGMWPPTTTGWGGYDDQHRSQNNLCAYVALVDDPMAMDLLIHFARTDQSTILRRVGAPRGVGRLVATWANFYTILPHEWAERIKGRLIEKIEAVLSRGSLAHHNNPVKVISYHGPDNRASVRNANGENLPSWVVWEHGLAAVGLYAAWKVTNDHRFLDVLTAICETVLGYGVFQEGGRDYICNNVWYPTGAGEEGRPITDFGVSYALDTPQLNVDVRQGGVVTWTTMAILIYTEIGNPGPLLDLAHRIKTDRGLDVEALGWRAAEWNACIEKNVP